MSYQHDEAFKDAQRQRANARWASGAKIGRPKLPETIAYEQERAIINAAKERAQPLGFERWRLEKGKKRVTLALSTRGQMALDFIMTELGVAYSSGGVSWRGAVIEQAVIEAAERMRLSPRKQEPSTERIDRNADR